jgi:hypothetical protein
MGAGRQALATDQYLAELRQHCLALAMLRLGARPATVTQWTGFDRRRTRGVVESYNSSRSASEPHCGSGPAPSALKRLLRDADLRDELTAAASLCRVLKLPFSQAALSSEALAQRLEVGEALCYGYNVYRRMVPNGHLTFEQFIVLVTALAVREDWALERCTACETYLLIDPLSLSRRLCGPCLNPSNRFAVDWTHPEVASETAVPEDHGLQQSLF